MSKSEDEARLQTFREIHQLIDEYTWWRRIYEFLKENPPPSNYWRTKALKLLEEKKSE